MQNLRSSVTSVVRRIHLVSTGFATMVLIALLAGSALTLAGCNTVEGIGEDLSAGGEAISGASRNVRDDNDDQ